MVCIFAFYEDSDFGSGWHLVSKEDILNQAHLAFFVRFYGLRNVRLRCGDFDYEVM